MRKFLLLPFLLLLVACGSSGADDAVTDSADEAAAGSTSPTAVAEAVVQASGDPITIAKSPQEAGEVRDRDWTKGAEDPLVTIIEYGDFQ